MADRKISALASLTGAAVVVADDLLTIVDISEALDADKNKKITVDELRKSLVFPSFKATKGGTNQTGVVDSTETLVTFGTEVYDVGGHFASNAWTPPAGKISMTAQIYFTGTISAGALCIVTIYRNSVLFAYSQHAANANSGCMSVTVDDVANGTDPYEVRVYIDVSSGTATIGGAADKTYFCGHWFSA